MFSLLSRTILLAILLAASSSVLAAAKTDVVYLHNGDRVTGEVKGLSRGRLKFSTDHMGTIFIEWEDILQIVSNTGQAVELTSGERFYGPLAKPENSDMVAVETEMGTVGVNTLDVVEMYPVDTGFWNRLDVTASLGFSWDKGSNVGKYTLGVDTEYRHTDFITRAGFSSEVTTQESLDDTHRAELNANHMRFRKNKKFIDYFGNLESNDSLGIDLRALIGAGYGWVPIRSNRNWFSLAAGLDANREIPTNGEAETNLEAVGMLNYEYYKYSTPERKFSVRLLVFPGLTNWGRWRASFDTEFRIEFIDDLYWIMDFYANYDSDPISFNAANSDYGVVSSLGYKF